ncbi:MAG: TolC family protein [Pseudomonadota bacterium]
MRARYRAWPRRLAAVALLACLGVARAADNPPLTLDAVLALADAAHPELDLARSQAAAAQAELALADSLNDFQLSLEGGLRSGRNDYYGDRFHPDHQAQLIARKRLYDGGRAEGRRLAARDEAGARALQVMDARAQRRLGLMTRYFDVLLAEMQYNADTEFMAVAYVNWDNAKDRHAIGQMPQWELAELEARYQESRSRRNDTLRKLREKRMQLGLAMNREGLVAEELADPGLPGNELALPDFDILLAHARAHNPRLLAQARLLEAARQRREAARADYRPSLEFETAAAAWTRESSTRDDVRAGINFVLPLWQGGRQDASLAREQARIDEAQAQQARLDMELRDALRAAWEEIQYLRDSERLNASTQATYRDLALEKARAEYELELKTNLGTSMAETQVAKLRRRAVEYRLALAWARIEALLGTPLTEVKRKDKS